MRKLIDILGMSVLALLLVSFLYAITGEIPVVLKIIWFVFGVIGVVYTLGSGMLWK